MALFQCFVIPPVLYRSAPLFRVASIVRGCSVIPVLFRHSVGVPCSGGVPSFRRCPVFRRSVFRCSWFYSMPFQMMQKSNNFEKVSNLADLPNLGYIYLNKDIIT